MPTIQFGHDNHDAEFGVIIALAVTLVGAFSIAMICYCVRKSDEKVILAQAEKIKGENA